MNAWIKKALELGFSQAAPLNIATLVPRQDVRDMCAADKCGAYGKNWTCPPHCALGLGDAGSAKPVPGRIHVAFRKKPGHPWRVTVFSSPRSAGIMDFPTTTGNAQLLIPPVSYFNR